MSSTVDMAVVTGRIGTLDIIAIACGSLLLVVLVMSFVLEAVCGRKEEKGKTDKNKTAPADGNENIGFQGDGNETARNGSVEDGIPLQQR
ncbi:Hypp6333 [Branchiostoma lanceolatum]|nr:Hypp6333 [Branchiostoma lanceolatum]